MAVQLSKGTPATVKIGGSTGVKSTAPVQTSKPAATSTTSAPRTTPIKSMMPATTTAAKTTTTPVSQISKAITSKETVTGVTFNPNASLQLSPQAKATLQSGGSLTTKVQYTGGVINEAPGKVVYSATPLKPANISAPSSLAPAANIVNSAVKQLSSTTNLYGQDVSTSLNTLKPISVSSNQASLQKSTDKIVGNFNSAALNETAKSINKIQLIDYSKLNSLNPVDAAALKVNNALSISKVNPVPSDVSKLNSSLADLTKKVEYHADNVTNLQKAYNINIDRLNVQNNNNINSLYGKNLVQINDVSAKAVANLAPLTNDIKLSTSSVLAEIASKSQATQNNLKTTAISGVNDLASALKDKINTAKTPEEVDRAVAFGQTAFNHLTDNYQEAKFISDYHFQAGTQGAVSQAAANLDHIKLTADQINAVKANGAKGLSDSALTAKVTFSDTALKAKNVYSDALASSLGLGARTIAQPLTAEQQKMEALVSKTRAEQNIQVAPIQMMSPEAAKALYGEEALNKQVQIGNKLHLEAINVGPLSIPTSIGEVIQGVEGNYLANASPGAKANIQESLNQAGTNVNPDIAAAAKGAGYNVQTPSTSIQSSGGEAYAPLPSVPTTAIPQTQNNIDYYGKLGYAPQPGGGWSPAGKGSESPIYGPNLTPSIPPTAAQPGTQVKIPGMISSFDFLTNALPGANQQLQQAQQAQQKQQAVNLSNLWSNPGGKVVSMVTHDNAGNTVRLDPYGIYNVSVGGQQVKSITANQLYDQYSNKIDSGSVQKQVYSVKGGWTEDVAKELGGVGLSTKDKLLQNGWVAITGIDRSEEGISGKPRVVDSPPSNPFGALAILSRKISNLDIPIDALTYGTLDAVGNGAKFIDDTTKQLSQGALPSQVIKASDGMTRGEKLSFLIKYSPDSIAKIAQSNPQAIAEMSQDPGLKMQLEGTLGSSVVSNAVNRYGNDSRVTASRGDYQAEAIISNVNEYLVSGGEGMPPLMSLALLAPESAAKLAIGSEKLAVKALTKETAVKATDHIITSLTEGGVEKFQVKNGAGNVIGEYTKGQKINGITVSDPETAAKAAMQKPNVAPVSYAAKETAQPVKPETRTPAAAGHEIKSIMPETKPVSSTTDVFGREELGRSVTFKPTTEFGLSEEAKAALAKGESPFTKVKTVGPIREEAPELKFTTEAETRGTKTTELPEVKTPKSSTAHEIKPMMPEAPAGFKSGMSLGTNPVTGNEVKAGKYVLGYTDSGQPFFEVTAAGNKVIGYETQLDGTLRAIDENGYTIGGRIIDSDGKVAPYENPLDQGQNPYDWAFGEGGAGESSGGAGSYYGGGEGGSAYTGAGGAGTVDTGATPQVHFDPNSNTNYVEVDGKKFYQDPGTGLYNVPESEQAKTNAAVAKQKADAEKAAQKATKHWDADLKAEYTEDPDTKVRTYYNPDTGSATTKEDLQAYLKQRDEKIAADAAAAAKAQADAKAAQDAAYQQQLALIQAQQATSVPATSYAPSLASQIYPHEALPATPVQQVTEATTTAAKATTEAMDYSKSGVDEIIKSVENDVSYWALPPNERTIVDNAIEAAQGTRVTTTPDDFLRWMASTDDKAFADRVREAYDEIFFKTKGYGSEWSLGRMYDAIKSGDLNEADDLFSRFTPSNLDFYTSRHTDLLDGLGRQEIELLSGDNVDYLLALKDERDYKKFIDSVGINILDTDQKQALFKASNGEDFTDKDVTAIRRLYTQLSETKQHMLEDALYGYEYALKEPAAYARMGQPPTISGRTIEKMNKDSFPSFIEFLGKNAEEIANKDEDEFYRIAIGLNDQKGPVTFLDADTLMPVNVPDELRDGARQASEFARGWFEARDSIKTAPIPEGAAKEQTIILRTLGWDYITTDLLNAVTKQTIDDVSAALGKKVVIGRRPSKSQLFQAFREEATGKVPYVPSPDVEKITDRRTIKNSIKMDDWGFDGSDPRTSDLWDDLDQLDPKYRPVLEEAWSTGSIPKGQEEVYRDAIENVLPEWLSSTIEEKVKAGPVEATTVAEQLANAPEMIVPKAEVTVAEAPVTPLRPLTTELEASTSEPQTVTVPQSEVPKPQTSEIKTVYENPTNYRETAYYNQLGDSSKNLLDRYALNLTDDSEQSSIDLLTRSADVEFRDLIAEAKNVISGAIPVEEAVAKGEAAAEEVAAPELIELPKAGEVPTVEETGGAGGEPPEGGQGLGGFFPNTPEGRGKRRIDNLLGRLNMLQGDMDRAAAAGDTANQKVIGKAITAEVNRITKLGLPELQSALTESDVRAYFGSRNTSQYLSNYGEKVRKWFVSDPRASEALDTAFANSRAGKLFESPNLAKLAADDQQFVRSMASARTVSSMDMRKLELVDAKLSLFKWMDDTRVEVSLMDRSDLNALRGIIRDNYGAYADILNPEAERLFIDARTAQLEGRVTDPSDVQFLTDLQKEGRFRSVSQENRLEDIEYKLTHTDASATHNDVLRLESEGNAAEAQRLSAINKPRYENPDSALSHEIGQADITDFYGKDGYLDQIRSHYGDNAARRSERAWVEENIDAIRGSDRLTPADQTTLDAIRNRGSLGGDLQKYLDIKNKVDAPAINVVESRLFELNDQVAENTGDQALRLERNAYASKYKKYYLDSIDARLPEFEAMNPDDVSKVTTNMLDAFGDSPEVRAAAKKVTQANISKRVDEILNGPNVDRIIGGIDEADRQWLRDLGDGKIGTVRAKDLERLAKFEQVVGKSRVKALLSALRPGKHWITFAKRHPGWAFTGLAFAFGTGATMTPWAAEEVWQMTVYGINMSCKQDPICLSQNLPAAMNSYMMARKWYLSMPISYVVSMPVIGDIIRSFGLGALDEFVRNGSVSDLQSYANDMCKQGTWDCSTQDNWGFGRARTMDEMRAYYAEHPEVLSASKIPAETIQNEFLKADCSGGICTLGKGSIFGEGQEAAQKFFWDVYLGGKWDDYKLPDALAAQFKTWKEEVFTNKRPDRVPGYDKYYQSYLDIQKQATTSPAGTVPGMINIGGSPLKASPFFADKDLSYISSNWNNSRVISDADKQLIESSFTTGGKLDLAKVRAYDPNFSYVNLEKMFPGQVVPAIQAELGNIAKTDKAAAFKRAGLLEQNNQLPIGAKALDVLPPEMKAEFTAYNDNPTNFKDSMHLTPTGSLEWTDLTGTGRWASSVVNDMAFNPSTGEYDIAASKLDENGKTNYKINTAEYIKWFNQEGDWKGKTLDQFLSSKDAWVCTYACDAIGSDSSTSGSKSSGGSSGGSKSSSSGQTGIYVSAGGIEADILLEGKKIGTSDKDIIPIAAGTYIITIAKDGYTPKTQAVTVYNGRTANVNVTLYKVSPDICTFIEDIGGPDSIIRDHVVYIYCLYKGYTYLANLIKPKIFVPSNMPTKIYYSEVKYLFDLYSGDTAEANALVTAQTVCKYTKAGVP